MFTQEQLKQTAWEAWKHIDSRDEKIAIKHFDAWWKLRLIENQRNPVLCTCDKGYCVKQNNINKICRHFNVLIQQDYLH